MTKQLWGPKDKQHIDLEINAAGSQFKYYSIHNLKRHANVVEEIKSLPSLLINHCFLTENKIVYGYYAADEASVFEPLVTKKYPSFQNISNELYNFNYHLNLLRSQEDNQVISAN